MNARQKIQIERVGEKNGRPRLVVIIDDQVHHVWWDADDPEEPSVPEGNAGSLERDDG